MNSLDSYDCLNANILWVLRNKGYVINGYDIFFDGGGFNIWHQKGVMQLYANVYMSNFSFMKKNNIQYRHFRNEKEGIYLDEKDFFEKYYVLIKVNTNVLKYDNYYKAIDNGIHIIILEGIENTKAMILDVFVPSNNIHINKGCVDLKELYKVWEYNEFETILIEKYFDDSLSKVAFDTNKEFVESCLTYLNGKIRYSEDLYLDPQLECAFGRMAVVEMIEDYLKVIRVETEGIFGLTQKFVLQIRWGGYLGYLKYMKSYLSEKEEMNRWALEVSSLIQKWDSNLLFLLRYSMRKDVSAINLVGDKMKKIVSKECEILYNIVNRI